MEKLYLVLKKACVFYFLLCSLHAFTQTNLVVYKIHGTPKLKTNNTIQNISKGALINPESKVILATKDTLLLIDKNGNTFKINTKGEYSTKDINKNPVATSSTSFTKKYFSYVWNKFIKNEEQKTKIGVVFRNDNVVLLQPSDSVKLYTSEIKFVWNTDYKESFFHLKNVKDNHITKFGVNGSFVTLFVDNTILNRGEMYQWAISEKKFPNLDDLVFYNFSLLTLDAFNTLKPEFDSFKKDMLSLGFSNKEIKEMLCNDYKICY